VAARAAFKVATRVVDLRVDLQPVLQAGRVDTHRPAEAAAAVPGPMARARAVDL
jgi:hypothetical protein